MKTVSITTPAELDKAVKEINAPIIKAQQAHAAEVLATLERRLADFRNSIKWAVEDGKTVELECNLRNIATAAFDGIAQAPKPISDHDVFQALIFG